MTEKELHLRYLEEKSMLERYGYISVITYEEWKEIKKNQMQVWN